MHNFRLRPIVTSFDTVPIEILSNEFGCEPYRGNVLGDAAVLLE